MNTYIKLHQPNGFNFFQIDPSSFFLFSLGLPLSSPLLCFWPEVASSES
jgi:hypothetical protein